MSHLAIAGLFREGGPAARLPAATAARLERLDMLADLDLLPRNLGVLLGKGSPSL